MLIEKCDLQDYSGAIEDHTISIENYPIHGGGYICRGYARYKLGDKEGACADWIGTRQGSWVGEKDAYYLIKLFLAKDIFAQMS